MRKLLNTLVLFIGLLLLSSCKANNAQTRDYTYFDTMIRITIYSNVDQKETFNKTNEILKDYHIITNRYEDETDNLKGIYSLNKNKTNVKVDKRLIELLKDSIKNYGVSDYFNILIGSVSDLWHPYFESYNEADETNNDKITSLPDTSSLIVEKDTSKIIIDEESETISITNDMSIDLGGIVKGYVSKVLIDYYDSLNLKYVIDMGQSNIYTNYGNPKRKDNSYYVGLINPSDKKNVYSIINLKPGYSIVTSGDYQRYFTYNNRIYSHILDINTKESAVTDIRSISIILKDPMIGDIYSTSLFMMGSVKAIEFVNSHDDLECIIYKNNGEIIKSSNMNQYIIK